MLNAEFIFKINAISTNAAAVFFPSSQQKLHLNNWNREIIEKNTHTERVSEREKQKIKLNQI